MRKFILMALLSFVSSNAMAGWVAVTATTDNSVTFYVYPDATRKNDSVVKMWWLEDLKQADKAGNDKPYSSAKGLDEFDCQKVQRRTLAFSEYSGNMGSGEVSLSSDYESPKWSPISPDSVEEALWKYACRQ